MFSVCLECLKRVFFSIKEHNTRTYAFRNVREEITFWSEKCKIIRKEGRIECSITETYEDTNEGNSDFYAKYENCD